MRIVKEDKQSERDNENHVQKTTRTQKPDFLEPCPVWFYRALTHTHVLKEHHSQRIIRNPCEEQLRQTRDTLSMLVCFHYAL